MIDTIIISGGNIQNGFALDFLKKRIEESRGGFKYPLNGYHLTVEDSGLTVSNEISEETAEILYESGQLLMIMSRD